MPFHAAQIVLQGHLAGPTAPGESGRRADVLNTACPGGIVRLVVPWPERDQAEIVAGQSVRHREIRRNEKLTAHLAMLARRMASLAGARIGHLPLAGRRALKVPQAPEPDDRAGGEDYASQKQCKFKALEK